MSQQPVARLGDSSSHGGTIISHGSKFRCDGIYVARLGDLHSCPLPHHGITSITTASPRVKSEGQYVAAITSVTGCGAFCHPPNEVAAIMKECIEEYNAGSWFVAVKNDHNTRLAHNPLGNVYPFKQITVEPITLKACCCKTAGMRDMGSPVIVACRAGLRTLPMPWR